MSTARKPGRPVDKELQERRRAEILDAAAKLFAEKGYAQADTQDLADRLGIAKGTVFRYFPTKRELFTAALDRSMEKLRLSVDAAAAAATDPIAMLLAAMTGYLQFFDDHAEVVELLILERAEFKDRKSTYFEHRERCEETDDIWRRRLLDLIEAGRFRDIPVDRILNVLGDLLYGAIFSNHMSGRTRTLAEQAHELFDIVLHGLFTDEERGVARRRGNS